MSQLFGALEIAPAPAVASTLGQSTHATSAMKLLIAEEQFHYFSFDAASMPSYEAMVELISSAWTHDYSANGQAVFKYDEEYLRWMLKPDTFDGIWVTTPDGRAAGLMLLTRRTISTKDGSIPCHYGSLFSIATEFRRAGIGRRIYEVYFYHMTKGSRALIGVMDGDSGGKKVTDAFLNKDTQRGSSALWSQLSQAYTLWAACPDMPLLLRYMPMPGLLGRLVTSTLVRWFIEFRYKQPKHKNYRVELVEPFGFERPRASEAVSFAPDASLLKQYGLGQSNVGATYRVSFDDGNHCEIYYTIHKITKAQLADSIAGHIQLVDQATASSSQVRHALKIVSDELFRKGCLAVLMHHTGMVSTSCLVRAGFLPSDRKVRYYIGYVPKLAPPLSLNHKPHFDLL